MRLRIFLLLILCVSIQNNILAQAPVFSQFYSTGLYLNPALAGIEKDTYFGINYRSQWGNINVPFTTFQFSFIKPLTDKVTGRKHYGGLGASVFRDVAGPNGEFQSLGANIAGAYNIHFNTRNSNVVVLGLQAGLYQKSLNEGFIQWSSQYNPDSGFDDNLAGEPGYENSSILYPVINAGGVWYYESKNFRKRLTFFNGISISNINHPNESFWDDKQHRLPLLYRMHGGINIPAGLIWHLSPNYVINYQNGLAQFNVGAYLTCKLNQSFQQGSGKLTIGAWYRFKDAVIFSAGFKTDRIGLSFSYDRNTSYLGRYMGGTGAYEISMSMRIVKFRQIRRFSSPLI